MTRFVLIIGLLTGVFSLQAQYRLHWRFANPSLVTSENQQYLEFDVELACSHEGTYQSSMMIFFSYNPETFGENIFKSGNVACTRLELLDLDLQGAEGYSMIQADFSPTVYALTTEAAFMVAGDTFLEKIPQYPDFGGFVRFRIKLSDPSKPAGIAFVPDTGPTYHTGLMDKNQYYLDPVSKTEILYGSPEKYDADYENDLKEYIPSQ